MDENPYKAPDDDELNASDPPAAKQSDLLDPMQNAIALLIVVAVMALAIVGGTIRAGKSAVNSQTGSASKSTASS